MQTVRFSNTVMTEREYFLGSQGPFLYDDEDSYPDDSALAGFSMTGMASERQVVLGVSPTVDEQPGPVRSN